MLHQLRELGIEINIDDFGTGYSSLSYLHRFPFDILKIDRSFISRMNTEKESKGIVKTIMTLASELGKDVVAEGIETEAQRLLLTEMACQFGQGYLFSKPLSADKVDALFTKEALWTTTNAALNTDLHCNDVEAVSSTYTM